MTTRRYTCRLYISHPTGLFALYIRRTSGMSLIAPGWTKYSTAGLYKHAPGIYNFVNAAYS